MMDSVIVGDHPVIASRHVEEVDVNVDHVDVGDVFYVELVVGMSNQRTCDSCVLRTEKRFVLHDQLTHSPSQAPPDNLG